MKLTIVPWPMHKENDYYDHVLSTAFTKFWRQSGNYQSSFKKAAKLFADQCNMKVTEIVSQELDRRLIIDITKEELLLLHIRYG